MLNESKDENILANLVHTKGRLSIDTYPDTAIVELNGKKIGSTPLIMSVNFGEYALAISNPRFKTIKEKLIINKLKNELINEGEHVEQINNDLRFGQGKDWFVLIHPSNTESVIRIISEAKRESLARVYCEATSELVKLVIDSM